MRMADFDTVSFFPKIAVLAFTFFCLASWTRAAYTNKSDTATVERVLNFVAWVALVAFPISWLFR